MRGRHKNLCGDDIMVLITSQMLLECIDWETATKDTITIKKIDVEKLREMVYDDIKLSLDNYGRDDEDTTTVYCQDAPFITLNTNELFSKENCEQLAIEIINRLNTEMKSRLRVED